MKTCDKCEKRKVRYTVRLKSATVNRQSKKWDGPAERLCASCRRNGVSQ